MKRILTLALAALLVVAFAIPAFAAPKIELVSGSFAAEATFDATTPYGLQNAITFADLKFKFSADNFTATATIDPMLADLTDYTFDLALPYMTLSGYYDSYNAWCEAEWYGPIHIARELRLASDDKFKELAGFGWAVYANDSAETGAFGSLHASLDIPVGEAFSAKLNYAHEDDIVVDNHSAWLNLTYNFTDDLYVDTIVGKDITNLASDFFFTTTVGFPIVEGFSGTFFAQYGMADFVGDTDLNNYGGYALGFFGDTAEAYLDLAYNNESANAEFFVDYATKAAALGEGDISVFAEYVSNGGNSLWNSNNRRANYADTNDKIGRGWNTKFDWVRGNSGNEYAVRVNGSYNLVDSSYGVTGWFMFAPDVVPVVITAKGDYASTGDWNFRNWLGVRINPDIHFALYDRYVVTAGTGTFDIDAALVYFKDSVTAKLTGVNLFDNEGDRGVVLGLGLYF